MTPHMGGLAFCSVGISLSILTQTLWNSVHVVYSILWTHCRYFLWTKLLWGKWRNLSCCHTCRQMPSESEWQNTLMMRLMRLISKFSNVCHIWCVTMMWLGRRSKTKAPLVAVAIVFWMSTNTSLCLFSSQRLKVVRIFLLYHSSQCLLLTIPVFMQLIWNVFYYSVCISSQADDFEWVLQLYHDHFVSPFLFQASNLKWASESLAVRIPHITLALCSSAYFSHFRL